MRSRNTISKVKRAISLGEMAIKPFLILILLFFVFFCQVQEGKTSEVPNKIKVVFDLNVGRPQLLLLRLNLIEETLIEISKIKDYSAVIVVRGEASDFMAKEDKYIPSKALAIKRKIYVQLKKLKDIYRVKIEQCKIALKLRGIEPPEVYDFIDLVENGYTSLIIYQNQGYAFIPMD